MSPLIQRMLSVVTLGTVLRIVQMILAWVDRRRGAGIMHERINAGSDAFFSHDVKHAGDLEIEGLSPPRSRIKLSALWRRRR